MPRTNPKYELLDAITVAASGAYARLEGKVDPQTVLYETMRTRPRIENPQAFVEVIIAELGVERYLQMLRAVSGETVLGQAA